MEQQPKPKIGRPKKPKPPSEVMRALIPVDDLFTPEEKVNYNGMLDAYLQDFDPKQLTSNDMDDIISIAMNRVLEIRLLMAGKGSAAKLVDVSASLEKLRKQTEKLKESLATRRKDRVDPKKYSGFSIIDVILKFDESRKRVMQDKIDKFHEEEKEIDYDLLTGNSEDEDSFVIRLEDD